ncbi:MAG: AAA family ATPase [Streptosporangiaceae bacterium]
MFVSSVSVEQELISDAGQDHWPFAIPCVAAIARDGLDLTCPVTFLVGENGSGKSTLVEAIAEASGLDARGGRAGRKYGNNREKTPLGKVLRLGLTRDGAKMWSGSRSRRKGYFLRAETTFGFAEVVSGMSGYWEENLDERSHGEGFLVIFESMFNAPGLYLMDEPEAALSFRSCLRLVALMHQLGGTGAQVICATHSPILASVPGADIIELGEHGYRRAEWSDLDLTDNWRRYLANPGSYLRRLLQAAGTR